MSVIIRNESSSQRARSQPRSLLGPLYPPGTRLETQVPDISLFFCKKERRISLESITVGLVLPLPLS